VAVAALIVSIVALLVAAASGFYARQQARSAEGTRRIEAARRHGELTPVLDASYVEARSTREKARPAVLLTNRGPLDLDRIEVSAIPPPRADDAVIKGIYDPRTGPTATLHETGPLRRGESWTALEVIPAVDVVEGGHELERGGTVSFRCTCYGGGEEPWTIVVDVDFPATPWVW
jgi:hypothetical protein